MRIRRHRPPGIVPLEIWDLEIGGGLLYERPEQLPEALELLRRGEARARWSRSPLWAARDFDSLFLGGGRTVAFPPAPYRIEISPDGAFVGERGGLAFLEGDGLVVDVGQSAIKVTGPNGRRTIPRDTAALPIRAPDEADREVAEQRRRSREFLAEALRGARRIVLALPCRLDKRGVPGRCSYIGWEGDSTLVPDALRLAGAGEAEVWLLQDSELAGLSCPPLGKRTLVVTLGYAVAACVKLSP